jgi:hypothetical protein
VLISDYWINLKEQEYKLCVVQNCPLKHNEINNQIFLMIPVISFFVIVALNTTLSHITIAYSQNQSFSFQAEAKALTVNSV